MVQLLQLIISGAAIGCIYALIALGFVLIYKATETVNFAQGDIMMIGGFVGLTAMTLGGLPFWAAFLVTIVVSKLDASQTAVAEKALFDDQYVRAQTGIGAASASNH